VIKDGPNQPLHAMSFLELLGEFPLNGGTNNSEERQEIGSQAVNIADKLLVELTTRVIALLNEVRKEYIEFDMQVCSSGCAVACVALDPSCVRVCVCVCVCVRVFLSYHHPCFLSLCSAQT
jgi:hypothetical protein